jgi:hypothetical protein
MASGDKQFKQDLIVSARYKNDLPPPPMPPKFLDIDTGGIENYLTTSYASGLVRREEPNIEVDAEGGMPIDMIGVPGYFLGDESAIMAPERPPLLDPADAELLLSVDQIKAQNTSRNVSFLRKTQILSTSNSKSVDLFTKSSRPRQSLNRKEEPPVDRDDKENVKRNVQKGFDLAYPDTIPYNHESVRSLPRTAAEREAWDKPKHPSGARDIYPVDFYPVLHDFEATNDQGGLWQRIKFDKPPLPADHGRRDDRIDIATFQTIPNESLLPEWKAKKDAFDADPANYDDPGPEPNIWVMATPTSHDVSSIRKHLYDGHPDRDAPTLVEPLLTKSASSQMRVEFERKRVFHSVTQQLVDPRRLWAIGLYNPQSDKNIMPPSAQKLKQGKAAYVYPIADNVRFRADRSKINNPSGLSQIQRQDDDENIEAADMYMYRPRELDPRETYDRVQRRGEYDYAFKDEYAQIERDAIAFEEAQEAARIQEEQGALEGGEADVDMAEVEAAEDAEVALDTSNGTRPMRDDTDGEERVVNGHADDKLNAAVAAMGDSDEELLDD